MSNFADVRSAAYHFEICKVVAQQIKGLMNSCISVKEVSWIGKFLA